MSDVLYDQDNVTRYRTAATELHTLRADVGERIKVAIENGDMAAARGALEELQACGEKFQELRSTLTARDLFVVKYNIQVHGPHEVSFVLPKGVSRYEMLSEAQGVVTDRKLVYPRQLEKWRADPVLQKSSDAPERIRIEARLQGGDGKDRATQEALVQGLGYTLPSLEDLAAAFVAHYVATGEPLFGWSDKVNEWSFWVRAAGGALHCFCYGLRVDGGRDVKNLSPVGVSARIPGN
jgi:hypothetical protein